MPRARLSVIALLTALAPGAGLGFQAPDRGHALKTADEPAPIEACPMAVVNAPAFDDMRRIIGVRSKVTVGGVALLVAPVDRACLSSGFGMRGGRRHAGVDYYAPDGTVVAAADGVVREATTRADFGNMLLIEHGVGVFTRYAHLASFSRAFRVGDRVEAGAALGSVGMTGDARAPHLHYEILVGDMNGPAGSFGLTALDPIGLSRSEAAEEARAAAAASMATP